MINDEYTPEDVQDENKNDNGQEETTEETQEETQDQPAESKSNEDDKDWKAEALKYKAILERNKNKPQIKESPAKKSDGIGYAEKAYLTVNGIKGETETNLVKEIMRETGKSLEQVLESKYFKAELEEVRELAQSKNATIKGKSPNGVPTDSVEYWMTKPIDEVPKDMRIKVVNAKLKQSESKGVFYDA